MRRYKISRSVGKRLRIIRRKKRLTQEEVAEKIRMHVSTLGRIERGESNPPVHTIEKIAKTLRIKVSELF